MNETLTRDGRFRGLLNDGVAIFRGITYATYERFGDAVIVEPGFSKEAAGTGIAPEASATFPVDATDYGCVCPQHSCNLASIIGEDKGSVIGEGRLCLSVYAPEGAEGCPVMVWIHGGSFITGGSEERRYSGERMVRAGNAVVVKISYRLGALGYLYLPEKGIVNQGLKDQKLALEWIRRNVGSFGGDPSDITVFGQSAGALSIAAIIATATEPLPFGKAILQSAPLGIGITPKEASRIARAFLRKLGKDLDEATTEEILDAQDAVAGMKVGLTFMPMVEDFRHVPEAARGLKVVVGYTAQDASPFLTALGPLFDTFIGRAVIRFATRAIFARPSEQYFTRLRAAGAEADRYFIKWCPEGSPLGSCHCIELPFLLGDCEDWRRSKMLQGMTREEYDSNSAAALKVWTGFAAEGIFRHEGIICYL